MRAVRTAKYSFRISIMSFTNENIYIGILPWKCDFWWRSVGMSLSKLTKMYYVDRINQGFPQWQNNCVQHAPVILIPCGWSQATSWQQQRTFNSQCYQWIEENNKSSSRLPHRIILIPQDKDERVGPLWSQQTEQNSSLRQQVPGA